MELTEIDIHELTEDQRQSLCELIGEDYQEMAGLDENPIHVWYLPGDNLTLIKIHEDAEVRRQSAREHPWRHDR